MMPPAFEYHYWKCYYPANSPSFKAAALYSIEVDYYTYGMCRLVNGKYYCGPLSNLAPWKSLASTADSPHVASDPYTRMDIPTGSAVYTPGEGNFAKLQRPANPDYYSKSAPSAREFVQSRTNNGMYVNTPSSVKLSADNTETAATAFYNQHTNDVLTGDATTRYPVASETSNYGMTPTTARTYNSGTHVVGGTSTHGSQWGLEPDTY